jgi:hypothetical protein
MFPESPSSVFDVMNIVFAWSTCTPRNRPAHSAPRGERWAESDDQRTSCTCADRVRSRL